jgi:Transposase domain (DUF772)
MVGYFEGIASERGIAWRCSDSMSLRDFLRLQSREKVPDHSWLSKTRGRLPHEDWERWVGLLKRKPKSSMASNNQALELPLTHRDPEQDPRSAPVFRSLEPFSKL